ncbi:MAG: GAF domain-containing protein, partial [Deltaproteobacteria bacterium]|nr:GAF domain-containing protein [Deltaproteobacteria bacterium]
WPIAHHSALYQHAVVEVNGQPIDSAEELYALVRRLPPGSPITYTLEKDGQTSQFSLPSLLFTRKDYILLFVPYLFSGLALALIGIGVWFLKPTASASLALFIGGLSGGVFALTGADLYGPAWFFRLHVLGEALFPASLLVHLALVFPVDRFRRYRALLLALPYVVVGLLAVAYEIFLYQPAAYSFIHNLCMVYAGIGGIALLSAVIWDYSTTDSHLTRQRIRVILLGFLGGFAFPGGVMFASGITGGEVSVNYAGFTVFLFPLSLGYAIVKHDLFEIDALLKRGVYYLALTATLTFAYIAFLAIFDLTLRSSALMPLPSLPLLFTLAVVFFLNPLKDSLQKGIDRIFFRLRYNPRKVLEETSAALVSTLTLEEVLIFIWRTIEETLGVRQGGIFLLTPERKQYVMVYPRLAETYTLPSAHPLISAVRRQRRIYALEDLTAEAGSPEGRGLSWPTLARLGAQMVVPLTFESDLIGFIALGNKASGAFFTVDDADFLLPLANQSALSITNALAYQEIQTLNTALEKKVEERTQELAHTNEELQFSLEQLEQAYRQLQRSQESLFRVEKMAALGRLSAGIAHEMNTPLGASLTSLKLLQELVEEYSFSIADPTVSTQDHQAIAVDMERLVSVTQQWLEKAAAHIRSFKLHTRDLPEGEEQTFSVLQVIEDTKLLLSHRLRFAQCILVVSCTAAEPVVYGDPSKLGQVLTNLIVNAIDAYKDLMGGEIYVDVAEAGGGLEIGVRDHGCGILRENLERIFEEFFSTKPIGEGTGLGLSIARDIVTNFFGGTISVESIPGQESVFTLQLPRNSKEKKVLSPRPETRVVESLV